MATTLMDKQHILNSLGKVTSGGPRSLFMNHSIFSRLLLYLHFARKVATVRTELRQFHHLFLFWFSSLYCLSRAYLWELASTVISRFPWRCVLETPTCTRFDVTMLATLCPWLSSLVTSHQVDRKCNFHIILFNKSLVNVEWWFTILGLATIGLP
jgi:hypothetical protein